MNTDHLFAAFAGQVIADAWCEAPSRYWLRRAEQLEAARPRPGDYPGQATPLQLAGRHARLTEAAQACRHRATLLDGTAEVTFHDTLQDIARHAPATPTQLEQLESLFRAALVRGDTAEIDHLATLIDAHDPALAGAAA